MAETWYKLNHLGDIEETQVERHTSASVFLKSGRREAVRSEWHRYYETREAAEQQWRTQLTEKIAHHELMAAHFKKLLAAREQASR